MMLRIRGSIRVIFDAVGHGGDESGSEDPDRRWQQDQSRRSLSRTTTGHLPSSARLISRLTFAVENPAEGRECP